MLPALDPLHILALHCNQCPFLTLSVARLFEHCMSHKDSSDCTLLQCQQCGIVATHRGILEEHTQAWHPSAPLSVRQISTTTVQAAGSTNGRLQFPRYGCQFCSFRNDDHVKVSRHYLSVHNITNVDLHAKAAAVDGFGEDFAQQQQNHSLCNQQSPRLQQRKQQQQESSPLPAASVQLVQLSTSAPCMSSAPTSAAAASTSPLSAILPTVTLIRQPQQQQQQQFLLQSGSMSAAGSSATATARSASDDSGYEAEPQLPLLPGIGKVEILDDSEPTASGEEDLEDSEMITDNSLIMDSVASMRAGSSILTMSLEPDYDDRVNGGLSLKVFPAGAAATVDAPPATTAASSSAAASVPANSEPVSRSTPKPSSLTFHQATTASMACKPDRDKAQLKMIPVESFGKRYEVLTRNLRQMGGRLLIGQRLDRGTLDFSCQCRYCRRVVKLSKPKAYKFKIHLRTCKERRKTSLDGVETVAAGSAAAKDAEELEATAPAAQNRLSVRQQQEEFEDDEEEAEHSSLAASETRPDGGADSPSPLIDLPLASQEIPA
ncbi:hypothetical protein BOX15_Mlig002430g1 [Macrostomum lignano]|uniref:Uncharacterized protein n=2 Tax=Macrostomum lignano TaxID=282301 RepID=A0A267DQ90_9PLAT|nr:hypothetical protein BOX15_Mlig002430g1 [Macrostomum lignano]